MRRWLAAADAVVRGLVDGLGAALTRLVPPDRPPAEPPEDPRHR
ncbi:hypothetical protein ACFFOM_18975 [Microlunatus capsulatus]|uniref:Uncharacterized protein n=1 Tax=Microlunatus capsulatus TaxID=99117 RepID=A0ABS4ZDG3_9ACTN|nr:hypothetical protein [Microlunatus capsulatus]MBP2419093.1 hypothetical protein [Microlunatus capsulatus]